MRWGGWSVVKAPGLDFRDSPVGRLCSAAETCGLLREGCARSVGPASDCQWAVFRGQGTRRHHPSASRFRPHAAPLTGQSSLRRERTKKVLVDGSFPSTSSHLASTLFLALQTAICNCCTPFLHCLRVWNQPPEEGSVPVTLLKFFPDPPCCRRRHCRGREPGAGQQRPSGSCRGRLIYKRASNLSRRQLCMDLKLVISLVRNSGRHLVCSTTTSAHWRNSDMATCGNRRRMLRELRFCVSFVRQATAKAQ